ncbi:MAG: methylenetetrahydrofolate reductase, partial [Boseongicola sp. SB0677_bin_26]|nr:methylenetetrahydrofolate reductase [Boseongicola sp. SB0677_bin_26]
MALAKFRSRSDRAEPADPQVSDFLDGFSIEVMPRTAAKVDDFRAILPIGTRVYIAHIEGTSIEEMVATARRLSSDGFRVMPHFPARIIKDEAMLDEWVARYQGEAGVEDALVLAGGVASPAGEFDSSMQLLESGAFDRAGFKHLHVA